MENMEEDTSIEDQYEEMNAKVSRVLIKLNLIKKGKWQRLQNTYTYKNMVFWGFPIEFIWQ